MQPSVPAARDVARPSVFLLAGAFVTGLLLVLHGGCGNQECVNAFDCAEQVTPDSQGNGWTCVEHVCQRVTFPPPAETDAGTSTDAGTRDDGGSAATVSVKIIAFNDFHGQLEPAGGTGGQIITALLPDGGAADRVNAGGAVYFARHVADLRAKNPNTVVVSAGDLIGATPLLSALFHDEPTIEVMNQVGLDLAAVGNHEFDEGGSELLRMQAGGCHPVDGCQDGTGFEGARFKYLAANVATGPDRTLFPRYDVRTFEGVKVAFIGMTLEGTPQIVTPSGVAGLTFKDEVETVNALVPELKSQGVGAIVIVVHEGGMPALDSLYNECKGISGPILDIAQKLDPAVNVIVSGHTHQAYNCSLSGKLVTSAASVGRLLTDIDLTLDAKTGALTQAQAQNVIVTRTVTPDPTVTEQVARYKGLTTPLENRVIGWIDQTLTRGDILKDPTGQSTMGFVIADAQLEATKPAGQGGAVVAFMNPGGVRTDLVRDAANPSDTGAITYGEAFTVQPFGNSLVTLTLTGAQIERLLEQQFRPGTATRILHPSAGFSYAFSAAAPLGSKVDPASIQLNGVTVDPAASYRVTVNSFLAPGGDGFTVLTEGTNLLGGAVDADALEAYLTAKSTEANPLPAPALDRVTRLP
ncbi:bifunctional metallophosphatase/5'-nucleotidase [Corallococcus praedator]|uniref:Bifunctional metallophosphatase/5'-nucleotidase n=1 Tax=Corallococcus praedator TaxID=2316724 RepID=A0ABX9QQ26_9BACT|nr:MULTISPECIES: bifunctional metallophosphatase/5'-nucleotidase [Corallococcus]RKH35408.1 bifunctional metallophosphatase/5'-nucleotidase [Corallococcus sp. CA031C]RKI15711.1 bifunctional metallophosphatase/5'-nucleotidase [Corallococcus praedator]